MEMLCIMQDADPYGHLGVNQRVIRHFELARLAKCSEGEVEGLLKELEENGVFSRREDGMIYSRRMVRDQERRAIARENGRRGGNPALRGSDNQVVNQKDKGRLIQPDNRHLVQVQVQDGEKGGGERKEKGVQGEEPGESRRVEGLERQHAEEGGNSSAGGDEAPAPASGEGSGGDKPANGDSGGRTREAYVYPSFDDWWNLYDKKDDRKKCEAKWARISQDDRERMMQHTRLYVTRGRGAEYKYRRSPLTYLNGENWNDSGLLLGNSGPGHTPNNDHGQPAGQDPIADDPLTARIAAALAGKAGLGQADH